MLHVLHEASDREKLEEDIIPLLPAQDYQLVVFPFSEDFHPGQDDILILFLSDENLKKVVLQAVKHEWKLCILPHSNNQFTSKGFGLTLNSEKVIEQMLNCGKAQEMDLLFCNKEPVFEAVNIGSFFALTQEETRNNLFAEAFQIIRKMRKASSLSHQPFEISSGDEKIISTSALGMVAAEHPSGSVVSKRLIGDSAVNNGTFTSFIVSPQNLLSLLWFFLKSLWPGKAELSRVPSFVGIIRAKELSITGEDEITYTIDGKKFTSQSLDFYVEPRVVHLYQESKFFTTQGEVGKKSLKIEGLPTGEAKKELIKRKIPILPRASSEQFEDLFKVLRQNSETSSEYLTMMILSTLIATFGLFADSSPVIIGAMILAPIIAPIVSFSMGMVRYEITMLKKGLFTITIGTLVALAIAAGVTLVIPLQVITPEIEGRLSPSLLDLGIAIASGIAAAYGHAKEGIAKSLAGVAIAVALVPPLSVAGIGIGWMDWNVFSGALLLYATNLAGIILFAGITFLVLGYAPFKRAKMGLIYTLIIVAMVTVPLSLSFGRIMKKAEITRILEGTRIDEVVVRDVRIRFGNPLIVSVRLVGNQIIEPKEMERIKEKIEERINEPVVLEVVSSLAF